MICMSCGSLLKGTRYRVSIPKRFTARPYVRASKTGMLHQGCAALVVRKMIARGMTVTITSLAMRFSLSAGWTEEILKKYLTHGKLILRGFGTDESKYQYYILDVNSHLDIDQMFKDGVVGHVVGKEHYGETRNLSDIDAMKRRNW